MKHLLLLALGICVFITQAQVTQGLSCYMCHYSPGVAGSTDSCEKAPLPAQQKDFNFPPEVGAQKMYTYCFTATGTLLGKRVVIRGGTPLLKDAGEVCQDLGVTLPIPGVKDVKTCFCNKDNCNDGDNGGPSPPGPNPTDSTQPPVIETTSGASRSRFVAFTSVFLSTILLTLLS